MVMCSSDLGCLIGTWVTQVTRVAQSKSALEVVSATGGWVGGTINPLLLMF